jgi:hypothetical protein
MTRPRTAGPQNIAKVAEYPINAMYQPYWVRFPSRRMGRLVLAMMQTGHRGAQLDRHTNTGRTPKIFSSVLSKPSLFLLIKKLTRGCLP